MSELDGLLTARELDSLLIRRVPLLRDALLAMAVERSRAEAAAILFGRIDDETFERVMRTLGQVTADDEWVGHGPWRPEPLIDGEGLRRRRGSIWLADDDGCSLLVDEDEAAVLANARSAAALSVLDEAVKR